MVRSKPVRRAQAGGLLLVALLALPAPLAVVGAQESALPNLVVESLVVEPESPVSGDLVSVTATFRNVGGASAAAHSMMVRIDRSNGDSVWSTMTTRVLAAGEAQTLTTERVLAEGSFVARALTDYEENVAESDEGDNEQTQAITVGQGLPADLVVLDIEVRLPTAETYWHTRVTFSVANLGPAPSPASTLRITYDGREGEYDVPPLDAGQSRAIVAASTWLPGGTHMASAWVDPHGTLAEANESNNFRSFTFETPRADLVVTDLRVEVDPVGQYYAHGRVENTGAFPAWTDVRLDIGETPYGWDSVGLFPGQGANVSFALGWVPGGTQTLRLVADAREEIQESNESNNELSLTYALPQADLQVRILNVTTERAFGWASRNVVVEACNVGAWRMRMGEFSLSASTEGFAGVTGGEETVGSKRLWNLVPGQCQTETFQHRPSSLAGYTYVATATSSEADADASNNRAEAKDGVLLAGVVVPQL